MSTAIASAEKVSPKKRLITLEKFLERYSSRKDDFKYEWNNGLVEKKIRSIQRSHYKIIRALMNQFYKSKSMNHDGFIAQGVDMFLPFSNRTRCADLAFLTRKQIDAAEGGDLSVCSFVIEVISQKEKINEVKEKIIEYFENDVKVVWVIFPKLKKVEVYTSIRDVKICFDNDICSANPVMDDFNISVNDLFA
jgi:Uma2 family endonuclease